MSEFNFSVPEFNVAKLEAKLSKLNKRAAKLNQPVISYELSEPYDKLIELAEESGSIGDTYITFVDVKISGEVPSIKGWNIIASIDHEDGLNIIRGFEEVPVAYRERKPYCDHCNSHRIKIKSVVIKNGESGEYKQVGRSCLKEFVSSEVANELSYLAGFNAFIDEFDEEFGFGGNAPRESIKYNVKEAFTVAASAIRRFGFKPSSAEYPTKYDLVNYFIPSLNDKSLRNDLIAGIEERDEQYAEEAIKWISEKDENSDFFYNLRQIISRTGTPARNFGYIAGAVFAYKKFVEANVAKKARLNEYLPFEEKKRVELELTLKWINASESYYGTTYIHTFHDNEGRTVVWFSSAGRIASEGETLKVKATIKGFNEYNETKQTIVTRVTEVK